MILKVNSIIFISAVITHVIDKRTKHENEDNDNELDKI